MIKTLITMVLSFFAVVTLAKEKASTTHIVGKKAEALIYGLLVSGFDGTVVNNERTIKIDKLELKQGFGHECDDEDSLMCGFTSPIEISTAVQAGKNVETSNDSQLGEILRYTGLPSTDDSGMGKMYQDFGRITCTWTTKAAKNSAAYKIEKPVCSNTLAAE